MMKKMMAITEEDYKRDIQAARRQGLGVAARMCLWLTENPRVFESGVTFESIYEKVKAEAPPVIHMAGKGPVGCPSWNDGRCNEIPLPEQDWELDWQDAPGEFWYGTDRSTRTVPPRKYKPAHDPEKSLGFQPYGHHESEVSRRLRQQAEADAHPKLDINETPARDPEQSLAEDKPQPEVSFGCSWFNLFGESWAGAKERENLRNLETRLRYLEQKHEGDGK